jgi:hypothetical protein
MKSVRFLLLVVFLPAAALAQPLGGTIRGQVVTTSGLPQANVRVTAINQETGEVRKTLSASDGQYALSSLIPGRYRLEAETPGFRKHLQAGIDLQIGRDVRLDVRLEPGGPSDEVSVSAVRKPVEPDRTNTGGVVENQQIVNLPLDGRNFLQLTLLLPGTAPAAQGSPGSVRGTFAINVNGAREDSNNFVLDGAYNNDPKLNSFAINPPVDAIREFEILTGSYDASSGRTAGAQVNIVTKAGANEIHGTAYEFIRNAALDARNFFARAEDAAPRYQRNQFGFSLGGPIRKNQTFFFGDYEGRRMREGITQVTNVPTAQERAGDFSESIHAGPLDPFTGALFPTGRIPSDRVSTIGKAIAALYPLPNRAVPGQNYVSSPVLRDSDDRFDIRLDHLITDNCNLFARYSFADGDLYEPFSGPSFARIPGFGTDVPRRAQNFVIGGDYGPTPTLVNQARFAFNRVALGVYHENTGNSLNRAVGLPELSDKSRDFGLSFITVSNFSPLGDEYNNPQNSVTNVFQLMDTVTYSPGRHLVRFGVDFRALQQNAFRDVQSRGMMAFSDFGQVTGNGLADLLLGFITYSGGARLDNPQYLRTRSWNFFVQDSYRVRPSVTLQLGLRHEYNAPPADRYDRANTYDPLTRSLVAVGAGDVPRSVFEPDRNNWAPRIGIAWSPGEGNLSVVRAGYGIYYDQASLAPGEGLYFNKPYYDFRLYFPLQGLPLTLNDPFPANYPFPIPGSALGFDRHLRTPYFQHWNLAFGRQIGANGMAEVVYAGSAGRRILAARDINEPAPSPVQPNLRPVPQFADIVFLESRGNSSYNSLQFSYRQRLVTRLASLVSYTFGKSLDDGSTFFSSSGDANFPQDSRNPGAERGRSNFDVRHRLAVSYSYEFPGSRGGPLPGGRFVSMLFGGWSTHGIVTLQSGRPFTVALLPEMDNSNTGLASLGFGANDRPNRLGSGKLESPEPDQWFDMRAFAPAPYGSFGNSGRNILGGPSYHDVSLSLTKDSRLSEAATVQFRAEFFNAFNRANLDLPNIFWGSPAFGRISSAASPRRIQFGLKLLF